MEAPRRKKKALLLGIGLDNDDGHIRATRGRNFQILGGSHDTHQQMTEKCLKFNDKLKDRRKELEDLRAEEFYELAADCEMNVVRGPDKTEHGPEGTDRQ